MHLQPKRVLISIRLMVIKPLALSSHNEMIWFNNPSKLFGRLYFIYKKRKKLKDNIKKKRKTRTWNKSGEIRRESCNIQLLLSK